MTVLTVSQLNRYIKAVIEEDKKLSDLYIKGEISNFTRHFKSGHCYFSLKDEGGLIKAVMFKSNVDDLRFEPENGMSVLVRAHMGVFERDGAYQLYVTDMQPQGAGAAAVAFEQLKQRLLSKGLFDEAHKKPLPDFPRSIGVVTSRTGAALQDIINVISRRYPVCGLLTVHADVQGENAAPALISALKLLDGRCDVIIIGRGGGSAEDLRAFNDEALAYAVYEAKTPVVSAVGHEVDYTICDFVADLRAPTPSVAAELVTPSAQALKQRVLGYREYFSRHAENLLESEAERLRELRNSPGLSSPRDSIMKAQQRLDFFSQSLYNNKILCRLQENLRTKAALLRSLNPAEVLSRGYSIIYHDGKAVSKAACLKPGDKLSVRFCDGYLNALVLEETDGEEYKL